MDSCDSIATSKEQGGASHWFGAHVEQQNSFALCGCTVAPGFDFRDFEMADRKELLEKYPGFEKEILRLTRG